MSKVQSTEGRKLLLTQKSLELFLCNQQSVPVEPGAQIGL